VGTSHPTWTRQRVGSALAALGVAVAALVSAAPSAFAAPGLSVSPGSGVAAGATVSVSGSGYSATANNGVGIYVAWCKLVPQYWVSADNCGDARWVHVGGGGAGQAVMTAGGSFNTSLTLAAAVAGAECTVPGVCKVVTMAAHGSSDRSQDAVVGVAFAAIAPVAPPVAVVPSVVPKTTAAVVAPKTSAAVAVPTPLAASTTSTLVTSVPATSAAPSDVVATPSSPAPSLRAIADEKPAGSAVWPWLVGGLILLTVIGGSTTLAFRRRSPPAS
jgi:hypothetical protein